MGRNLVGFHENMATSNNFIASSHSHPISKSLIQNDTNALDMMDMSQKRQNPPTFVTPSPQLIPVSVSMSPFLCQVSTACRGAIA